MEGIELFLSYILYNLDKFGVVAITLAMVLYFLNKDNSEDSESIIQKFKNIMSDTGIKVDFDGKIFHLRKDE